MESGLEEVAAEGGRVAVEGIGALLAAGVGADVVAAEGEARASKLEVCSRVLMMSKLRETCQHPVPPSQVSTTHGYGTTALRAPANPPASSIRPTSALFIRPFSKVLPAGDGGGTSGSAFDKDEEEGGG